MNTKVIGTPTGKLTSIHRFSLPGVIIKSSCPMCGTEVEVDLAYNYILKPEFNGQSFVNMYHDDCPVGNGTTTWMQSVRLKVELEII